MHKINALKELVVEKLGWTWVGQPEGLTNAQLDGAAFPVVVFEPYRIGKIDLSYTFSRVDTVELHFMKLTPTDGKNVSTMEQDGEAIIQAQEEIVSTIRRFIRLYNASGVFRRINDWHLEFEPPMFDAAEVSVMLRFNCILNEVCL